MSVFKAPTGTTQFWIRFTGRDRALYPRSGFSECGHIQPGQILKAVAAEDHPLGYVFGSTPGVWAISRDSGVYTRVYTSEYEIITA